MDALPAGSRIASFEIEAVIARGPSTFVYLAHDLTRGMPVAIKEYAPARRAGVGGGVGVGVGVGSGAGVSAIQRSQPLDSVLQSGLQAFMAEARMLASCHHPSLVRVDALLDAHGTAYRVMPFYKGLSLVHLRTSLGRAPDDATLRAWGSDLVGALQAMHNAGHAHGFVSPENILLLADDRPLLFGAGSACHRVGSNLVASLLADFGLGGASSVASGAPNPELLAFVEADVLRESMSADALRTVLQEARSRSAPPPEGMADDLRALAAVLRFCIDGEAFTGAGAADTADAIFVDDSAVTSVVSTVASPVASPVAPPQPSLKKPVEPPLSERWFAAPAHTEGPRALAKPLHLVQPPHEPELEPRFASEANFDAAPPVRDAAPSSFIPLHWHIPLWVALIGLVGVAVLLVMSYVMGAWNRIPFIDYDRNVQPAASALALPAPVPAPVASPKLPSRRNPAEPARSTAAPSPLPEVENQTAPLLTKPNDAPAARVAAKLGTITETATETTSAPAGEKATAGEKDAAPQRSARPAQPTAAVKLSSPLEACGNRTNFSLERCLQTQCQDKKWATHPQCLSRL